MSQPMTDHKKAAEDLKRWMDEPEMMTEVDQEIAWRKEAYAKLDDVNILLNERIAELNLRIDIATKALEEIHSGVKPGIDLPCSLDKYQIMDIAREALERINEK